MNLKNGVKATFANIFRYNFIKIVNKFYFLKTFVYKLMIANQNLKN